MPNPNQARVDRGYLILRDYADASLGSPSGTTLTDALTDLRHYAKANGLSFNHARKASLRHFKAETADTAPAPIDSPTSAPVDARDIADGGIHRIV